MTDLKRAWATAAFGAALFALAIAGEHRAAASTASGMGEATDRVAMGTEWNVRRVNGDATTPAAFWPSSEKRIDSVCINNNSFAIWVSTDADDTAAQIVDAGYPILSSGTIHMGGVNGGVLRFVCNPGQSACNVRCLDAVIP